MGEDRKFRNPLVWMGGKSRWICGAKLKMNAYASRANRFVVGSGIETSHLLEMVGNEYD